ncbi:unnamed protein product [Menidia menidia]|uniref:(Atlantic silverside) hypothetical protein n=1 Tax=Menidia menidia TaxID=238744 RepID=A0A8S4ANJ1_9TELE|nr:unnamed protein product [Menidia menidia]
MLEETDPKEKLRVDPSVNSHRPSSGTSQDISHILESIFKDVYTNDTIGKDTLSNIVKTKSGRSAFLDKYVEELQQAHGEYEQRIEEADMLETHIIQARARAAAKESRALETMMENLKDVPDYQGLLTVKSAFSWCVDEELLKKSNLISPEDYLVTTQKPQVTAPRAVKPNPTKPTISYTMHTSREPQDDGYTLIVKKEKAVLEMDESKQSLTNESCADTKERNTGFIENQHQVKPTPKWRNELSKKDRAEGWKKLQKLKERQSFLRNPRFLPPNAQQGGMSLLRPRPKGKTEHEKKGSQERSSLDDPPQIFLPNPSVVLFTDYGVGHFYETTLELKNVTSSSRHVRVIPPTTPHFSIGLGRFPSEGGIVAPGMSCKYTLRFAPDSLGNYEDFVVVETQDEKQLVPIEARRPPPILTIPKVLNCGYCLVGGVKFVEFLCQNVGFSSGSFCIIPKNQWPASNLRSVSSTYFSEQPPFAVGPSLFVLQPGEATIVEVVFFPTAAGRSCQVFTVVCDNCQVKEISIEGEGQLIALELVSGSGETELPLVGEVCDLTAEHFVRFSPSNPCSEQQKVLIIRNNVHLELPFHWQIVKPNLHPLLPGVTPDSSYIQCHPATDDVFHISPSAGLLAPCKDQGFLLTFCPKELKDYHSVCHLVLRDVPQPPPELCDSSVLQPVQSGSRVSNVTIMEIEVKGSTEPYQILLEPYAVVVVGEILLHTTIHRQFKMWNHSKTFIFFNWESFSSSCHMIKVEPSAGRIEENECFDFDLIITGGKPEKVVTSLVCSIQHHHEPVVLAVEVSFKGPTVTLSAPSVDFGLVKFGEHAQTSLLLSNTSPLEAYWRIEETFNNPQDRPDTQILVQPCRGVLPPLASCSVDVLFRPHFCQQFETDLELAVENGTGCHMLVRADVQSPQVCLLNCKLALSELYIGAPNRGTVTLFNQTLLPSHFTWMAQLQGKQASLCTASFDPISGILGPNARMEITVDITSLTDLELSEVAALCEVQGMNSPLVLGIVAPRPKKLSVSYSLPSVSLHQDDSPLVLDFGDDITLKRTVSRQFLITNQTAIPAPFTIEAEYFTCHASKPSSQSRKRFTYVKSPLQSAQAERAQAKAHKEFVSNLLANGKGAAFLAQPDSGMLGPFETQTVSVTAYSDMWGEYRDNLICKVGELEPVLIAMQMTVKGCPLYFQMTGPRADDQHQGPIIHFGTHLSGGDTVSRSVHINNPTMFDIRVDWESYNIDQNDCKLLDVVVAYGDAFPLKDADGNEVLSGAPRLSEADAPPAREETLKPSSEGTSSFLKSVTDVEKEEDYTSEGEEETSHFPSPAKKKLFSVYIRPHLGNLSDYPFCVTPQQTVIPARSSGTIHVSFTPLTLSGAACESRCVGLALGFMSLDTEMAACVPGKVGRAQGLDLEPVRMDLLAAVKPAALLVQMEEDGGVLEFNASAGDLLRAGSDKELSERELEITQTLQLINTSEMPLHFSLETQPPFSVLNPGPSLLSSSSSIPPTGDSQPPVLRPQRNMRVKVAFHCSLKLLDHADQAEVKVPPGVTLIHNDSGLKKLRFQKNLVIRFSNNSHLTVPLRAHLDLPTLSLSTDCLSFGFCFVGHTLTREVNLYSHGAHTYWKALTESDEGDSHVFGVAPDFGLLRSKEARGTRCRQCLQISFTPSEDREFRTVVVIQSPLVKTQLTLQIHGAGSFDEAYRSTNQTV